MAPKLLYVGLVEYFEVSSLFLDELYAEPCFIDWIRRVGVADSVLGMLFFLV